jgi:hypothetical protein
MYLHHLCEMAEANHYPFDLPALQRSPLETQMAYSWMIMNEKVIDEMHEQRNYGLLLYEDLCNDVVNVAKKMFEHAGLGWSGQTEDFIGRVGRTRAAGYSSVRRAPDSSLHRWRSELSRQQIEEIAAVTSCSRLHDMFAW